MHQNFSIRMIRRKHMPRIFQLRPQFAMIINTPIKHHRHDRQPRRHLARNDRRLPWLIGQIRAQPLPVVHHRLMPALVVDDAQPTMHKRDIDDRSVGTHRTIPEATLPVRSTMLDRLIEHIQPRLGDRLQMRRWGPITGFMNLDDARDAADGCDRIHWLGYVPDQDLPLIYCQAEALSYVSHYEGFGLPALESMNCGVPVIYGADTAVAEVVGDAGWAADANSIEQIYECFHEVATQPDSREERSKTAMIRSANFDWARVAESMWETYTAVADRRLERSAG